MRGRLGCIAHHWTGLDWTGLDWRGIICRIECRLHVCISARMRQSHSPGMQLPAHAHTALFAVSPSSFFFFCWYL